MGPAGAIRRGLCVALAAALSLTPVAALADTSAIAAHEALATLDARLNAVGERLAIANAGWCPDVTARTGLLLHDIAQYPDQTSARAAFGFAQPVLVAAVAPGSAAARAGLRIGDAPVALAIGDAAPDPIDLSEPGPRSSARVAAIRDRIDRMAEQARTAGQPLVMTVRRDASAIPITIKPLPGCASRFEIAPDKGDNAGADGRLVRVGDEMARAAPDDVALAAIVAHELSHNILRHRARIDTAENRLSVVRKTEEEADRLSIWLLAQAGYDPNAAIAAWAARWRGRMVFDGRYARFSTRLRWMREERAAISAAPPGALPPLLTSR